MRKETMLQQVMTAPGVIEFREIPVPQPEKGQVLVKIHRIGVCGSDIHVYHGKHPFTSYPVTQGHEVSGSIEALGEGVTGLSVGQKVTIEPQVTCGHCHPCTHGKYNLAGWCPGSRALPWERPDHFSPRWPWWRPPSPGCPVRRR